MELLLKKNAFPFMKHRVLFVFGTRPEAIKMAPVIRAFKSQTEDVETRVCVTAQHREMLDQVLHFFDIEADYDLNLMKPSQTLHQLTADIILALKEPLESFKPHFTLVHGDTSTTMAASIAAFYSGSTVCHVEAGLRTYNKYAPFPEEMNRQVTSRIADIHFAPTNQARKNLLSENIADANIVVTGNTVIDALFDCIEILKNHNDEAIEHLSSMLDTNKKLILVTGHRRENHGQGFINICEALLEISNDPDVQIIYPVHLNPKVKGPVHEYLSGKENILLIEPLAYQQFVWLMGKSYLIITDSGGVQEEAPSLGLPVLVMRETTERPEAIDAGTVILVGTNTQKIIEETQSLLHDKERYHKMSALHNPYGDGKASARMLDFILKQKIVDENE
jgi:UDP-N-acetylglucosamine 2-epimerase (non-hydrolysing)